MSGRRTHFKTGTIDLETRDCEARCLYDHEYVGLADDADLAVTGRHEVAEHERAERAAKQATVGTFPLSERAHAPSARRTTDADLWANGNP
jgi:hypothetical protein